MSIKLTSIAAGIAALASFGASAQVTLYGGGATLPANAYVGNAFFNASSPANSARLSVVDNIKNGNYEGSIFGETAQRGSGAGKIAAVSYCQTGSGTGRNVILGATAGTPASVPGTLTRADGTCPLFGGAAPTGFGAPAGTEDADFAASDAPLSSDEFTRGLTVQGAQHTQVVQFPVISAAIAISYNNADVPSTATPNLTTSQVCGIFNGTINNWSQLGFGTKPIKVVYRTDGSGTTFNFTNWLSANCPSSNGYQTSSTFAAAISPLPAGAVGASGNPNVATAIAANDGAIGYSEVADTKLRASLRFTNVNGKAPTALAAPKFTTLKDSALGPNNSNGRPTILSLAPPVAGCVLLADPSSYAIQPSTNYPIVAVSYFLAYNTGNRSVAALERLLTAPYNGTIKGASKDVGTGTGYAFLPGNLTSTIKKCVN